MLKFTSSVFLTTGCSSSVERSAGGREVASPILVTPTQMDFFYKYLFYPIMHFYVFIFQPQTQGVKVVIQNKDKLLFIKNSYGNNFWTLPGGGVKKGELPKDAALREVLEEANLKLKSIKFCDKFINKAEYKTDTVSVFYAKSDERIIKIDFKEIREARWVNITKLQTIKPTPLVKKCLDLAGVT